MMTPCTLETKGQVHNSLTTCLLIADEETESTSIDLPIRHGLVYNPSRIRYASTRTWAHALTDKHIACPLRADDESPRPGIGPGSTA